MSDKRLPIFPTRMNQTIIEQRLKSAEKGHSLLKRKSDALQHKYRTTQQELSELQDKLPKIMTKAYMSMAHAEFLGANLVSYINDCRKKSISIITTTEQISGVTLSTFKLASDPGSVMALGKSGQSLMKCRENFLDALQKLIEVCSVLNVFVALDEAFNSTNRRVNALEYLVIPKLRNTLQYILSELEEKEREDFYRLKKIQQKNKEN